jgi:RNA recognition motif-containing protein
MSKKLFVGSLPYSVTSEQLQELFEKAGKVDNATVITDKFSGKSRGFGFVEMSNDDEANKAKEMLNGYELDGRNIVVNEARSEGERRPARGGFRSSNRGEQRQRRY